MMKFMRKTSFIMKNKNSLYLFGSSSSSGHHNQHEDIPIITKHNPTGQMDLRGHAILDQLSPLQKSYSPLHNPEGASITSLNRLTSFLSNNAARSLAKIVANPKQSIASDNLYLPMINPGAIPVYDSLNVYGAYSLMNQVFVFIAPITSFLFEAHPLLSAFSIGTLYFAYYNMRWRVGKDVVIKLQLLPNTEELCYQKTSIFGGLRTSKVSINDLVPTTFDEIFGHNDPAQLSARGMANLEVAYRNKHTGQYFFFDRNGIWNQQGINHPLLI